MGNAGAALLDHDIVGLAKFLQFGIVSRLPLTPRDGIENIELMVLENFYPEMVHGESTNSICEVSSSGRILGSQFR